MDPGSDAPDTVAPAPAKHPPAAVAAPKSGEAPATGASAEPPPPPPPGTMEDMGFAQLQALDKITARVSRLEAKVGDPITFGSLTILVKACRKAPPEDTPESAAFLQIWERKPDEDSRWVYSGWMFASSPALAAMDHPVYDIWVLDCRKEATSAASSASASPASGAVPAPPPADPIPPAAPAPSPSPSPSPAR